MLTTFFILSITVNQQKLKKSKVAIFQLATLAKCRRMMHFWEMLEFFKNVFKRKSQKITALRSPSYHKPSCPPLCSSNGRKNKNPAGGKLTAPAEGESIFVVLRRVIKARRRCLSEGAVYSGGPFTDVPFCSQLCLWRSNRDIWRRRGRSSSPRTSTSTGERAR